VNFVVIDMDTHLSNDQLQLARRYYKGLIPHVVVTDRFGKPVYDDAGEVEEKTIIKSIEKALSK
jgi:hypothetical protein